MRSYMNFSAAAVQSYTLNVILELSLHLTSITHLSQPPDKPYYPNSVLLFVVANDTKEAAAQLKVYERARASSTRCP